MLQLYDKTCNTNVKIKVLTYKCQNGNINKNRLRD